MYYASVYNKDITGSFGKAWRYPIQVSGEAGFGSETGEYQRERSAGADGSTSASGAHCLPE
jgi:hypothetical protein